MKHLADYYKNTLNMAGGDGVFLYDDSGKKYIDFIAGWCVGNIGWKNEKVKEAIQKEAVEGRYIPPFMGFQKHEEFAKLLCEIAPNKKLTRAFRCTSGSEAVEFAVKCARASSGKKIIVSIDGVYHGHTYAAASVGDACSSKMSPCVPGCLKIPLPKNEPEAEASITEFEKIVKENKNNVAAFLSEPCWTNAGAFIPPKNFYPHIEKICRENNILLIMDEVATGFGRCGTLFASELWNLKPDILCLGKGLSGGYGTLGATLTTEEIFQKSKGIPFYSTFGWNALDLAASQANIEVILDKKVWKNSKEIGEYLLEKFREFEGLNGVCEVRGIGMLFGIELSDCKMANSAQNRCVENGLILDTIDNTLFITPPLILTKDIADEGFKILKKSISK